jgi:thymidylate synthase (FAD)
MRSELIDKMGTDLSVVNSARVSFSKESQWEYTHNGYPIKREYFGGSDLDKKDLSQADQKLINYLAKHNHWTPFSHVMITMRETVPIFVARQRFKHVVGFTYNETSRRYVDDAPEFFEPEVWRGKPLNAKQGSSDEVIEEPEFIWGHDKYNYREVLNLCTEYYEQLIKAGVAPEQARMVLPQSLYTSYYCTGSLAAWARAYKLRSDAHAQKEIQDLATQWNDIISGIPELKYSWSALTNKEVGWN